MQAAPPSRLRGPLLAWYDRARRDLPWRATRDPYAIWVSEVMSQQTRVETVVPYFDRWMARFPDVGALAAATEDEVFALWQGLGYYSRAGNLLAAARVVRDEHGGRLPSSVEALERLPGIGRYTAGAIASIAFDVRTSAIDGNVVRVLTRLAAMEDDVGAPRTMRRIREIAEALVPVARPGDFNQALMELGALVCTPRSPRCPACPVADGCAGRTRAESFPVKQPKAKPRAEHRVAFAASAPDGRVLVARNPAGTLLGGMWQYPMAPAPEPTRRPALRRAFAELTGLRAASLEAHEPLTHVFSHIRMQVTPVSVVVPDAPTRAPEVRGYDESAWMAPVELTAAAHSTLVRKLAARLAGAPRPGSDLNSDPELLETNAPEPREPRA